MSCSHWNNVDVVHSCGQQGSTVRADLDPEDTATLLLSAIEGAIGLSAGERRPRLLDGARRGILGLVGVVPPNGGQRSG